MIGVRSITYHLPQNHNQEDLNKIIKISRIWSNRYSMIRTQRVTLPPLNKPENRKVINALSKMCDISDIRWFNVPIDPWDSENPEILFKFAESILHNQNRAFVNVLCFKDGKASQNIMELSANLMRHVSQLSKNGKDNFRLGLSSNIKPDGPFFPFTMSSGNFSFSIALELTQEINKICEENKKLNLTDLRNIIEKFLIDQIKTINSIALEISKEMEIEFKGFDFSIAPIISEDGSVISILNQLGIYNFGKAGMLFSTAFLTNLIKSFQQHFKSVGFSGVMYSLLEDIELCMINNERGVSIEELIELSTMCGCGIDMVPVYGDVSNQELFTLFLEIYAISTRLQKPLGIRILPIPQCKKNQNYFTDLYDDADFIANTKVIDIDLNILSSFGEQFTFINQMMMQKEIR